MGINTVFNCSLGSLGVSNISFSNLYTKESNSIEELDDIENEQEYFNEFVPLQSQYDFDSQAVVHHLTESTSNPANI